MNTLCKAEIIESADAVIRFIKVQAVSKKLTNGEYLDLLERLADFVMMSVDETVHELEHEHAERGGVSPPDLILFLGLLTVLLLAIVLDVWAVAKDEEGPHGRR